MNRIDAVGGEGCKATVETHVGSVTARDIALAAQPAIAVVRELAESDPFRDAICVHCRRHRDDFVIERDGAGEVAHRGPHEPTCLWLRARKMAGMG